ncbi:hypothetical protein AWZ03_012134 [Drosophila navojoa]|uniref:Uncharacterized protein n=1 Tax=Drosophila navojoa TaxID=7232 RepID=A0A484AY75_DRONA|nr:hypothetical protein AWZ03_012134 [Drosophila navojoa]
MPQRNEENNSSNSSSSSSSSSAAAATTATKTTATTIIAITIETSTTILFVGMFQMPKRFQQLRRTAKGQAKQFGNGQWALAPALAM